jgi:hypothetical protein
MTAMKRSLPKILPGARAGGMVAVSLLAAAGAAAATSTAAAASTAAEAAASTANAAVVPAHAPTWHDVLTLLNGTALNSFSVVVATGKTTGWAFMNVSPVAYERTGATTWKKVPFPGKGGSVAAAGASSPSNVWASYFTAQGSQVDHWNGGKWAVVKTFPGYINGFSVLGTDDVWAYGGLSEDTGQGVWHFNGHTWTQVAKTLDGGSALSDKNVWAYAGTKIAHFNGAKWTAVNVAKLLPPPVPMGSFPGKPYLTGIVALSASDVYAIGTGINMPHGGPVVILRYNGHAWSKAAAGEFTSFSGQGLTPDGKGGLWIPAGGLDGNPALLHYSAGKLTRVFLPAAANEYTLVYSISRIPGTAEELAGGVHSTDGSETSTSVILQYS